MKVTVQGVGEVDLTQRHFLAQGGEGQVFARDSVAYKIYTDPAKMIPVGKIHELAGISDSNVIKPENVILDKAGHPIGFTMRYVSDTTVMCQAFTRAFREREGVTSDAMLALVRKFQAQVSCVHQAGVLVVDLNEMNFLVGAGFKDVYAIDVDSYQTKHYRATALMETVRDRHATPNTFDERTDWFAFAIVSFQMFIGIHPYKGRHPTFKTLDERMQGNVSVFDKDVGIPKVCYPFDVIPPAYLDWYTRLFDKGERMPPPIDLRRLVAVVSNIPVMRTIAATQKLTISEIVSFDGNVSYWERSSSSVAVTSRSIYYGGQRISAVVPVVRGCGFTLTRNRGVIASLYRGDLKLLVVDEPSPVGPSVTSPKVKEIPFGMRVQEVTSHDGRLYAKSGDQIVEIVLHDVGSNIIAAPRVVANCLEHATHLYDGVAVQNILGATFVSIFSRAGVAYQVRIKELDGHKIVDTKYDGGVLMVVASEKGRYDRHVFRLDADCSVYDVRTVTDVTPTGLNFVTLDTGICVCLTEEERLEVFSNKRGSTQMRIVEDAVLGGDMVLCKHQGKVAFARGNKLYRMSLTGGV